MDAEGVEEVCLVVVVVVVKGGGAGHGDSLIGGAAKAVRLLTHCLLIALAACRMSPARRNTGIVSFLCLAAATRHQLALIDRKSFAQSVNQSVSQSVGPSDSDAVIAVLVRAICPFLHVRWK